MDYDSDSSAGDDASTGDDAQYRYTTTVLGYASKEPTGDTISHLGGKPVI
jgi:pre-rRNA-processing protein TSR4